MGVPAEIRSVPRPTNTVVVDNGRDGPKRFAVRERNGYSPTSAGGNSQPKNGKTVGYIDGGKFVPVAMKAHRFQPEYLQYGAARFVRGFMDDIYDDLCGIYDISDIYTILSVAMCFIISRDTAYYAVRNEYRNSFVSVYFNGASVSKNSLQDLIRRLGMNEEARLMFFQRRIERTLSSNHHIAIDSTLVQDTSVVNDLSNFSWKARIKGCKDVSVLYAFDIESMETLCASVYPGNCVDASSYSNFIRNNNIEHGIIVADKGFPVSKIENELHERPDLHYIAPLKRNAAVISEYGLDRYDGVLKGFGKRLEYKKHVVNDNKVYYSFRDADKASAEDKVYIDKSLTDDDFYDAAERYEKLHKFGTIVFRSDINTDPEIIYRAYSERWRLELVFKFYKSELDMDNTNVHDNFSVIGDKFLRTICTIITNKMLYFLSGTDVLKKFTYGRFIDKLESVWRRKDAHEPASRDDNGWQNRDHVNFDLLEAIGLVEPLPDRTPRKRGRPRKAAPLEPAPKRPRGRPKKVQA